jgi:hypothetical protein
MILLRDPHRLGHAAWNSLTTRSLSLAFKFAQQDLAHAHAHAHAHTGGEKRCFTKGE